MKIWLFYALFVLTICSGCSSAEKKSAELLDTATFEEKQNNFEHATKLYNEIIATYPTSQAAKNAASRLDILKSRKP